MVRTVRRCVGVLCLFVLSWMIHAVFQRYRSDLEVTWTSMTTPEYVLPWSLYPSNAHVHASNMSLSYPSPRYLEISEVHDLKRLASSAFSKQAFVHNRSSYVVGEAIYVQIDLFDGYGDHLPVGGDILRIWLTDPASGSNVNGHVIDHDNGTYTGVVRALWRGSARVKTSISHTKEYIGIIMNYIEKHGHSYELYGTYRNAKVSENALCSVKPNTYGLRDMCNFTMENYGLHWYCGRPKHPALTCKDWKVHNNNNDHKIGLTAPSILAVRSRGHLSLSVKVIGDKESAQSKNVLCGRRSKLSTWYETPPVGFYFRRKWITLECQNTFIGSMEDYKKCLYGHRLVFLGDSNMRSWFRYLEKVLTLNNTFNNHPWFGMLKAHRQDLNLSATWLAHGLPFYVGHISRREAWKSVAWHLDQIPPSGHVVVVIHLWAHFVRTVPDEFRNHIRDIVNGIRRLLKRLPEAKVFIKGPHSFSYYGVPEPIDFIRKIQEQILTEEFDGLYDNVVYLNEWDMTVGNENRDVHPNDKTVADMVNTFMSFLCSK